MKKIINGFRFDTDKADMVCRIVEGAQGDFRHIDASLYCTRRAKRFFLAGFGGAMTIFSRRSGDNAWTGDETIIPINEDAARTWAEKYAPEEQIERFFQVKDAD